LSAYQVYCSQLHYNVDDESFIYDAAVPRVGIGKKERGIQVLFAPINVASSSSSELDENFSEEEELCSNNDLESSINYDTESSNNNDSKSESIFLPDKKDYPMLNHHKFSISNKALHDKTVHEILKANEGEAIY
jgi:hypothetical protein